MSNVQPAENPFKDQENALFAEGAKAVAEQRYSDAVERFRRVLHANSDHEDAHYQLGLIFLNSGDPVSAIDHLQILTTLKPDNIRAWINLGHARLMAGRAKEALSAARQVRRLAGPEQKNNPVHLNLIAQCITASPAHEINPHFVEDVTACYQNPQINIKNLVDAGQQIFLRQKAPEKLLEHLTPDYMIRDFDALLSDPSLNWVVLNHPFLTALLRREVLWAESMENLFTALRRHLLDTISNGGAQTRLWPNSIEFVSALAHQCWINDYLYNAKDKELEMAKALALRIGKNLEGGTAPSPHELAIIACYRRLYLEPYAQALLDNSDLTQNDLMTHLLRVQILEPREENRIKTEELQQITSIDDEVSLLVKEQYEQFPYPRWVSTAVDRPVTLRYLINNQFPYLDHALLPAETAQPDILIAGCGTGRQPIENSMLLPNAHFTAVDITAASLAYAIRKTKEYNIERIRYGLADILKLEELNQNFDVVMCGGVLHHMHDPMAGWQVLKDITKPGGFMSIALYSEIARRHIVQAREFTQQQSFANDEDGIRDFRATIKKMGDDNPLKRLIGHRDFYSIPECRDLVFHVQEHRFTALDLENSIQSLGLEFLGFQNLDGAHKADYQARYKDDPHMLNLKNWHEYELEHPSLFRGMYQFWLRKPD